jgi:hypothetical protein
MKVWLFACGSEERFKRAHGFFRPYLRKVIFRQLNPACPALDTGATYAAALPALNAETATMSTVWPSPASGGTFTPPAIQSGWGSGYGCFY